MNADDVHALRKQVSDEAYNVARSFERDIEFAIRRSPFSVRWSVEVSLPDVATSALVEKLEEQLKKYLAEQKFSLDTFKAVNEGQTLTFSFTLSESQTQKNEESVES